LDLRTDHAWRPHRVLPLWALKTVAELQKVQLPDGAGSRTGLVGTACICREVTCIQVAVR